MNWALIMAGAVMLIGAPIHFMVGDEALRKIGRLELPSNRFGGPADTKVALRVTWHFGTIAFAFLGIWLVATGLRPDASFAAGAAFLSGTLLTCYAVLALGVRLFRHGLRRFYRHPGPLMLATAAALAWWGASAL